MRTATADFETYWDNDYTLTKMSPLEYVMDPRFEAISVSLKIDDYPTDVIFGHDKIEAVLRKFDWSQYALCGHNMSGFDSYIFAYRFGIRPRLWLCTAAMARPIYAKTCGVSLGKLVEELKIGRKDNTILMRTKGRRLADYTPEEIAQMEIYNRDDTDHCRAIFHKLLPHYTPSELWQIDALTRMRTEPKFELDFGLLETAASVERSNKHKAKLDLAKMLGFSWGDDATEDDVAEFIREQLASAQKFSALLESLGVPVPMKPSPTNPENVVPALAKTDEAFIALQSHPNPVVAAAAMTRLGEKSTLFETRVAKFITAGRMAGGRLPVPLRYCGADTTGRDSGEEYNCFTGETEVLTPEGWLRFDEWQGQPIMQWWPDGSLSFCAAPAYLKKKHDGDIVDIDAVLFSSAMTPDHRMVSVRGGRLVERTAGWVSDHTGLDGIPVCGRWGGTETSCYTPEETRLMVALAADACVLERKTQLPTLQIGLRRQRKIDRLRALLNDAECDFYVREYPPQDTHTGSHYTQQFVISRCRYPKGFGSWVLRLSREALDALVDELPHWDGWRNVHGDTTFATSDREQAKWVATAVHLSGRACSIREYDKGRIQVHIRRSRYTAVDTKSHVRVAPFFGNVYCAGVDSTYILIRRNDKISVAGQCQNLPRITPGNPKPTDALRRSMRAPAGYVVGVADQSGIELRVNHFLWKVPSSMALYEASPDKGDLYRAFASENLYGVPPDEITKPQRQVGKIAQLGLGFGAGSVTFQRVAKIMGGIDLPLESEDPDVMSATRVVDVWRAAYPEIVKGWKRANLCLTYIPKGIEAEVDPWGLVHTCREGFVLPSGRLIRYPDLRDEDDGQWADGRPKRSAFYGQGRHKARITGPKAVENIVQALARDSIFDCALEFFKRTGLRPSLRVHDELVYVFPKPQGSALLDELQSVMRTPPKWWPQLVVWSEGDLADTYGDAK